MKTFKKLELDNLLLDLRNRCHSILDKDTGTMDVNAIIFAGVNELFVSQLPDNKFIKFNPEEHKVSTNVIQLKRK